MGMMKSGLMTHLTTPLRRRSALKGIAASALSGVSAIASTQGVQRVMAHDATPATGFSDATDAFVVVRRYQLLSADSMDDLVQRVTHGFLPIMRAIPGFREYIFVDNGEGAHMTISLFDDQDGAAASTANAADWAATNVVELLEGPDGVTEGWVRIHVTA
jgi:hypothetical protein